MRYWKTSEIKRIKERYHIDGPKVLGIELGRTTKSVIMKAVRLGLKYKKPKYGPPDAVIAKLRERRRITELRQQDVATALGVSLSTVTNWENGICHPRLHYLLEWADLFNLTVTLARKKTIWEDHEYNPK